MIQFFHCQFFFFFFFFFQYCIFLFNIFVINMLCLKANNWIKPKEIDTHRSNGIFWVLCTALIRADFICPFGSQLNNCSSSLNNVICTCKYFVLLQMRSQTAQVLYAIRMMHAFDMEPVSVILGLCSQFLA